MNPPTAQAGDRGVVRSRTRQRWPDVTLHTGDAQDVLGEMPDASVDCVVTSPPYWRLRDYATATWTGGDPTCTHDIPIGQGTPDTADVPGCCRRCGAARVDGQYGLETTASAYIDTLRRVFTHLRRVVTPTGTLWLNLGDSYATNTDGYWCAQPGQPGQPRYRPMADVPVKNLLGMPWRTALALQADGLVLRNAIIWHKPNATPTPATDRLTCRHELLFLFTTGPRYFFDLDPIGEPHTNADPTGPRRSTRAGSTSSMRDGRHATSRGGMAGLPPRPADRDPGDVWSIPTHPTRHGHPAAFPVQIPLRAIAAGCPPGGVVLDPFSGIATTGVAARHLGRAYVGIELNPRFQAIAAARLTPMDAAALGGRS